MKTYLWYNTKTMEILNTFEWCGQAYKYSDMKPELLTKIIDVTNPVNIPILEELSVWEYYKEELRKGRINTLEKKKKELHKKLYDIQKELYQLKKK